MKFGRVWGLQSLMRECLEGHNEVEVSLAGMAFGMALDVLRQKCLICGE